MKPLQEDGLGISPPLYIGFHFNVLLGIFVIGCLCLWSLWDSFNPILHTPLMKISDQKYKEQVAKIPSSTLYRVLTENQTSLNLHSFRDFKEKPDIKWR
jgi:hypothetical protein